jgi:hypothetical protein
VDPIVNDVAGVRLSVVVFVPLTQLLELALMVPIVQELVLNNCNLGVLSRLVPMLLREIVGEVVCATKEYHTSGEVVFPQKADMLVVAVAEYNVPAVLAQVRSDVSVIAEAHASFAGAASTTQILKFQPLEGAAVTLLPFVNTLTR